MEIKKLTFSEWMKTIGMFLVQIPLELSSFIVCPIVLLFCKKEDEHLPPAFIWYDELNWGLNGDYGWIKDHFPEPKNRTWWARTRWLWRNRINGFQILEQGCDVKNLDISTFVMQGDPNATDKKGKENTCCVIRTKDKNKEEYFSMYLEKKWCPWFYLRIYVGWKLMDISNAKTQEDLDNWAASRAMEHKLHVLESVFSIHPLKRV